MDTLGHDAIISAIARTGRSRRRRVNWHFAAALVAMAMSAATIFAPAIF
jgi:hypothetical protein